jgi:single-strand DNA-binding protein
MYLNKAMVYGNLTRDPELKALPSGMQVCNLSVATNRTWNDGDGKKQEAVEYHNVVSFGKQAEVIAKYLTKGSPAYFEGRLQTSSWEKDGVKQYRTEIVAEKFEFGPKSNTDAPKADTPASVLPEYPPAEDDINPEDIPF